MAAFQFFLSLIEASGLTDDLSDDDAEFTVFAPTDEAFEALGPIVTKALEENPDTVTEILLQHVVGETTVDSITAFTIPGTSVTTLSDAMIPVGINTNNDSITYGGANVTMPDVFASNGVIHVIDNVVVADVEVPELAMNVAEVAAGNPEFSTLVTALGATGLDALLATEEEGRAFTVFAPTNAAFDALGPDAVTDLLADPDTLANILAYHVIESDDRILRDAAVSVAQSSDNIVETANEQSVALSFSDSTLFVNTSPVVMTDNVANNGVIHVLDQVLMPPEMRGEPTENIVEAAVANDDFSTLVTALTTAEITMGEGDDAVTMTLADVLADEDRVFTVFAPTNAAFDKIEDMTLMGLLEDNDGIGRCPPSTRR